MSEKFTVIIRSSDKINSSDKSGNCTIRLNCPSHYKYLDCKVLNIYINILDGVTFPNMAFCELNTEGLEIENGADTKYSSIKSIAFKSLYINESDSTNIRFRCLNFNTKQVHFKLLNNTGAILQQTLTSTTLGITTSAVTDYNSNWVLVLECEGHD
jgi:hypothetical protein